MDQRTPAPVPSEEDAWPPIEIRRGVISEMAEGDFKVFATLVDETLPGEDWRDVALQCMAAELRATSAQLEQTHYGLQVIGAMVNGLFGADMLEDTDDALLGLHGAGRRLREYIGLGPVPT